MTLGFKDEAAGERPLRPIRAGLAEKGAVADNDTLLARVPAKPYSEAQLGKRRFG